MKNILSKKPEDICKDILKIVGNNDVKIEVEENEKSSMYVFLNNTIYISNKEKKTKDKDKNQKSRLLVIAHECRHSVQPKTLQLLNFVISNIEIVLFVILIIAKLFFKINTTICYSYLLTALVSIGVRLGLELDAVINSVKIVSKFLIKNGVKKQNITDLFVFYRKEILKTLPIFILWLLAFKILRIMIIVGIM